jgi:hypothetical protein
MQPPIIRIIMVSTLLPLYGVTGVGIIEGLKIDAGVDDAEIVVTVEVGLTATVVDDGVGDTETVGDAVGEGRSPPIA